MTEPQFFKRRAGMTVGEIAALVEGEPRPGADLDRRLTDIASLDLAGPSDVTFIGEAQFVPHLKTTHAGLCLASPRFAALAPPELTVVAIAKPYPAFITVARALFPDALRPSALREARDVAPGATVDPSARLEPGVQIDPGAVIGPRAEIGGGTLIGANAVIGAEVRIGRNCSVGACVSISHALIGDRVIIHPGACLGQDGFGYIPGPRGSLKVPHVGRVIIQDDVEIGAGTTIDRGGIRDTVIGEGTKIDNLVQIGHNAAIGRHCIIVGQTGLSGSVTLEDYVMLGGQVGIADHVVVGEGARIAASSGVMHDVPAGARWAGSPALPSREYFRQVSSLRRLGRKEPSAAGNDPQATDPKP